MYLTFSDSTYIKAAGTNCSFSDCLLSIIKLKFGPMRTAVNLKSGVVGSGEESAHKRYRRSLRLPEFARAYLIFESLKPNCKTEYANRLLSSTKFVTCRVTRFVPITGFYRTIRAVFADYLRGDTGDGSHRFQLNVAQMQENPV
jgi:hypothetical protein